MNRKTYDIVKIIPFLVFLVLFTQCSIQKEGTSPKNTGKDNKELIKYAEKFKGVSYRYGGKLPQTGFDCSGFIAFVYKKFDIVLPPSTAGLIKIGDKIALNKVRAGDLLFFKGSNKKNSTVGHVALVTENKSGIVKIIHATSSKGVMSEIYNYSTYWKERFLFARRVIK